MEKADWDDWWPRWVWVGECFFWYRLTRVVPDKFHRAVKWLCVCVCVQKQFWRITQTPKSKSVYWYLDKSLAKISWKSIYNFLSNPVREVKINTEEKPLVLWLSSAAPATILQLCTLSGTTWVSQYQKKHLLTHTYRGHQSSLICSLIFYDPWHPPWSIYMPSSLFPQSVFKFS